MNKLNGKKTGRVLYCMALLLLLGGCQTGPGAVAKGATSPATGSGSCEFKAAEAPQTAPPEVYRLMTQCVQNGDLTSAVYLFALAGSRTMYDATRVDTQYAWSMHNKILKQNLSQLDEPLKNRFWQAIQQNMTQDGAKNALCTRLKALDKPAYAPDYMRIDPAANYYAKQANRLDWQKAVNHYNQCL